LVETFFITPVYNGEVVLDACMDLHLHGELLINYLMSKFPPTKRKLTFTSEREFIDTVIMPKLYVCQDIQQELEKVEKTPNEYAQTFTLKDEGGEPVLFTFVSELFSIPEVIFMPNMFSTLPLNTDTTLKPLQSIQEAIVFFYTKMR